jgi:hypothetical protein
MKGIRQKVMKNLESNLKGSMRFLDKPLCVFGRQEPVTKKTKQRKTRSK